MMKKLLSIIVLGLLWCNVGVAETMEVTKPSLSDDVRQMVIGILSVLATNANAAYWLHTPDFGTPRGGSETTWKSIYVY